MMGRIDSGLINYNLICITYHFRIYASHSISMHHISQPRCYCWLNDHNRIVLHHYFYCFYANGVQTWGSLFIIEQVWTTHQSFQEVRALATNYYVFFIRYGSNWGVMIVWPLTLTSEFGPTEHNAKVRMPTVTTQSKMLCGRKLLVLWLCCYDINFDLAWECRARALRIARNSSQIIKSIGFIVWGLMKEASGPVRW